MKSHEDKSLSDSSIIEWEKGQLSLCNHEKSSLQFSESQTQEPGDGEKMSCLTNLSGCIKQEKEGACLDVTVEMSASSSSQ